MLAEYEKAAAGLVLPGSGWDAEPLRAELEEKLASFEEQLRQDKARRFQCKAPFALDCKPVVCSTSQPCRRRPGQDGRAQPPCWSGHRVAS